MNPRIRNHLWTPTTESARPHLLFPEAVWRKLMTYVALCPVEINGFGYVRRESSELFVVDDVIILDQRATSVSVEVTPETLVEHITGMIERGEDAGTMRLQWHSHVEMDAYFSGTDTANIEAYDTDWMFSLVLNKFGDFEARLDLYRPFRVHIPVNVSVDIASDGALTRALSAEVRRKVSMTGGLWPRRVKLSDVGETLPAGDAGAISVGHLDEPVDTAVGGPDAR